MAGLYTHVTRASGTILTATIYNSDHQNHIDNHIPAMMDDYSTNLAQMQSQVDPGELGTENLATDLAGEIQRFRFALKELKGTTYWYESAVNLALISANNVFTGNNKFTGTFEIESVDAGAGIAPTLVLDRASPSQANNDFLASINWNGRDDAAAELSYFKIYARILDVAAASNDAQMTFEGMIADVATPMLKLGPGAVIGNTAVDKGIGSLNADGLYVKGHGTIAQHIPAFNNTYQVLGTILPQDDTIPQITEGDQVLSVNITPSNAGSRIWVVAILNVGGAAGLVITAAIFRVGFSDASNASSMLVNAATTMEQVAVSASYSTGDLTPCTFTVRVGSATATDAKLNGDNTNRNFGGVSISRVDVFEILPQ